MASQAFPTQRSVSQIVRRHTPGSLLYIDEHDLIGRVSEIKGEPDVNVDLRRLHSQVVRFIERWVDRDGEILGIELEVTVRDLVPIAPQHVIWEPYPHTYRCINDDCQVLQDGRANNFSGKCRRCGGTLRQLPYVYYHRCGMLDYLKPPTSVRCPRHGTEQLYFHDTRRFATSSWRCRACDYEHGFWFPRCGRERCRAQDPQHPRVQASFWNDQWVHYCQTVDYINLDEQLANKFLSSPRGKSMLHLSVLGEIDAGLNRLLRTLEQDEVSCPTCTAKIQHGARFCGQCGSRIPDELFQETNSMQGIDNPVTSDSGRCAWALLRDIETSRSLRDEAGRRTSIGTSDDPFIWGLERANTAGVFDVVLVSDFPLTTAALGYSRDRSGPPNWFRAFNRIEERIPIYTNAVLTEAWLVQLRATAIARWLIENAIEPFATQLRGIEAAEDTYKEWFIERISRADSSGSPDDLRLRDIVYALLHSYSHVTLLSLATRSGLESSSLGELILVDALAFVVYAGDSDLGALTAAFEQLVGVVFTSATEDYASCKFDPSCSHDEGGACVGCIQLFRGCHAFNENLSRAYLFGGTTGNQALGNVSAGYFAVAST